MLFTRTHVTQTSRQNSNELISTSCLPFVYTSDFYSAIFCKCNNPPYGISMLMRAQDKPNYSTNVMKHAQKDITQLVGAYPALADNLFALPPEVILWCHMLAQPLNNIRPFRLWVPLFGIVLHLKSALFHGICPARFTSSLKLIFSPGPGLGAPLSSYLEVALYKFHR